VRAQSSEQLVRPLSLGELVHVAGRIDCLEEAERAVVGAPSEEVKTGGAVRGQVGLDIRRPTIRLATGICR